MGSFPPSVTPAPPPGAAPSSGGPSGPPGGGGTPNMKLAMFGQVIEGLAKEYPQGQEGIKMMLEGLRKLQSSVTANSSPQQVPAPPR